MNVVRNRLALLLCLLILPAASAAEDASLYVGGRVFFGNYMQQKSGADKLPVEWIVMDVADDRALLLSSSVLLNKQYHTNWKLVTWEKCTLRKWLNSTFLDLAFSAEEQQRILPTETGQGITDKVFLLSKEEAVRYLPDAEERKGIPTEFAKRLGTSIWPDGTCKWWLRTNEESSLSDAVYFDGSTCYLCVDFDTTGVRPAIWIAIQ